MKKYIFGFGAIFICFLAQAQTTVRGKIFNEKTNEPLPFVNISLKNSTVGTTSDVEGRFSITWQGGDTTAIFSFVGFQTYTTTLSVIRPYLQVKLHEQTTELHEVVVRPEDNPALEIIRRVIRHKEQNDPDNLDSYSYNSYNKLILSLDDAPDTTKDKKLRVIQKLMEKQHLFVSESYTLRKHVRPNFNKETVLANQVSGLKDPFFAFMATDFQPFGLYKDYIPLLDIKYLNPISNGSTERYDFTVTDTIYHATDSVFILTYEPLPGKAFQGLKGQLYISSDGYALEHVIAQTADEHALIEFHIQQEYSKVGAHWFPVQLNSELRFKEYKLADRRPHYVQRSYLTDISIDHPISKKEFGVLNVDFDAFANRQKEAFWKLHRPDSLDWKEKNTYHFYDSLGPKINRLNTSMKVLESIIVGKFRAGAFYLPLENLIKFNQYENVRIGLGAETGERISRVFTLSGFIGYGYKDKAFKYGGGLQVNFYPQRDGYVKGSYRQDLAEPGASDFIKRPQGAVNNETIRSWRVFRMDSIRQYKAEFGFRPLRFTQVELFAEQQRRNPAQYEYSFVTTDDAFGLRKNFTIAETGVKIRMAWRENYTQIGNSKVVTNIAYPQFNLFAAHGFAGMWGGQYKFNKIEMQLDEQWTIRGLGVLTVQLDGGKIQGNVPYPFLFNGKGAQYNSSFFNNFVILNYFQTMGFYEFASDQFAYLFINHNFGRLTGTKNSIFRPELSVIHNMGIGSLSNLQAHQGILLKTMEKGYTESGLLVNNLIRFKYLKLLYLGVGVGAFYRYGNYALPSTQDNFAFKFQVTASF